MLQHSIRIRGLSFLFALLALCTSASLSTDAFAQGQPLPPPAAAAGSYMLGPNDRIRLKVYGEADLTGEYEVDSNGQVSIPLAGHVTAAGLTTKQLERAITSALAKGIVRDPRVNVEIALYRPYYITSAFPSASSDALSTSASRREVFAKLHRHENGNAGVAIVSSFCGATFILQRRNLFLTTRVAVGTRGASI